MRASAVAPSHAARLTRTARKHHTSRRTVRAVAAAAAPVVGDKDTKRQHVVVVGAGWGGLGAAKSLCEAGVDVTLIDALKDPSGSTPDLTPSGKPFEAGTRGFWKDYPNIVSVCAELGLDE